MAYTFLFSDETVNSYGTRVLTGGIRLIDFEKNPIVLWNHTRAWSDKEDQVLPIGKVVKLWVDGGKLYGDIEFDQKDPFAQKIEAKVEQKIINACSISVSVITTSEDASVVVQGQTRPTVMECSLREVSVVDIPSNKNCIRLYDDRTGRELNFSDDQENFLLPLIKNQNDMNFKDDVADALGMRGKNDADILAEVKRQREAAGENQTLRADKTKLEGELKTYREKEAAEKEEKVKNLVEKGIQDRKFTEKEREKYTTLATGDYAFAEELITGLPALVDPSDTTELADKGSAWDKRMEEIRSGRK